MSLTKVTSVLPRRVEVVTSGVVIRPIPDEVKEELGFVDKLGRPKSSRIELLPNDDVTVVQWELYNDRHGCDQCGTRSKSTRVVLLRNERTGVEFRSAGDCLKYHFNESIEEFARGSSLLVRLLDGLISALSLDEEYAVDTRTALSGALAHFRSLEAFTCSATGAAMETLRAASEEPQLASRGLLDDQLRQVMAYVELQEDFRRDPQRFDDRWRALRSHPIAWERTDWPKSLFEKALHNRQDLSLEDFQRLLEALDEVRKFSPDLRNPAVPPWGFATRDAYHEGLREYYQFQAEIAPVKQHYHAQKQEGLGGILLAQAERKDPFVFNLSAPRHIISWFTNIALANQDTIEGRGAQIVWAATHRQGDVGGEHKVELAELLGCAVYYRDRWSEAYGIWSQLQGNGRKMLEELGESPFDQPRARPAPQVDAVDPDPEGSIADDALERGTQSPTEDLAGDAVVADDALTDMAVAQELERLIAEVGDRRGKRLTEADVEQLRSNLIDVVIADLGGDATHLSEAEVRLKQELDRLSQRSQDAGGVPQAEAEAKHPVMSEPVAKAANDLVRLKSIATSSRRTAETKNLVKMRLRGESERVKKGVDAAKSLSLQPSWAFFSRTNKDLPWEATVEVPEDQPGLVSSLESLGWRTIRGPE